MRPYSDAAFVHENDELSYVSAMRLREDELFLRRIVQDLPKGQQEQSPHGRSQPEGRPHPPALRSLTPCATPQIDPADSAIEKIRKALARHD